MQEPQVEFVPARWWEAIRCIRLALETVRGRDPWADQVLARPWSWSSLLRYGYLLDNFFHSSTFVIRVSGERAGIVSMRLRPKFIYIDIVGLLPQFQRGHTGKRIAEFIYDYGIRHHYQWGVAAMALTNQPVHMLSTSFGGRLLGLSTTRLIRTASPPPLSLTSEFEVRPLTRSTAQAAWRRWRLDEVEHVAGHQVIEIATDLLGALPHGKYLALFYQGQEIGFALARQRKGELRVDLYPSTQFWSEASTASLVAAVARYLGSTIHSLTLTQTHANTLSAPESFGFERRRKEERHLVFFTPV